MLLSFQVRRPSHQMRGPMQNECGKWPGPALAANARGPPTRSRLMFVQDKHSNTRFLVDTGADVSVLPPTNSERKHQAIISLQAANNTKINTYGQKSMTLGLRRVFPWIFTIADTKYPILGADFLRNFDLLVDIGWTQLVDANTKVEVNGFVSNVGESTRLTVLNEVPSSKSEKLLADLPSLTITNSGDTPIPVKHNITHKIETTGRPVVSKPRRLAPERHDIAKNALYAINRSISVVWKGETRLVGQS